MAPPTRHSIITLMNVTGASRDAAVRMLEDHDGNLTEAIDAHFNKGDTKTHVTSSPGVYKDFMDTDDSSEDESPRPARRLRSAARLKTTESPFKPRNLKSLVESSGSGPVSRDATHTAPNHNPNSHLIFTDSGVVLVGPNHGANGFHELFYGSPHSTSSDDATYDNHEIEEEMIKAAIEASRAEGYKNLKFVQDNTTTQFDNESHAFEDVELAHAISLSIKLAEKQKEPDELGMHITEQSSNSTDAHVKKMGRLSTVNERQANTQTSSQLQSRKGDTCVQDEAENAVEQPLRGGVFSEEQHEASMLMAKQFGEFFDTSMYSFPYSSTRALQNEPDQNSSLHSLSPSQRPPILAAQRRLVEQQDNAYLDALEADKEKELKAKQEAQTAFERKRHQEEESRRQLLEEEECERKLAEKEESLLHEPPSEDAGVVTLRFLMPDGSRRERRFMKSDKLQLLFDYVDVGRVVKPGTYRLVRPYPRHPFAVQQHMLSLSELGLTNKQETLYLEYI